MRLSPRRARILGALAVASAVDVLLVLARVALPQGRDFAFLGWNLFLAWVPLLLALLVYDGFRRRASWLLLAPLGAGWLLFLPNAPYIVTDFVHLRGATGALWWYDAATIGACAATGLALGFVSLALVHRVVERVTGPIVAWAFAVGSLALASVGIYLGRFLELNSWDAITRPRLLAAYARSRLADPLGNPKLLAVTLFFVLFLSIGYALTRPAVDVDR
jgi:uncharacterized membrane protein